jgi:hypothetical protein
MDTNTLDLSAGSICTTSLKAQCSASKLQVVSARSRYGCHMGPRASMLVAQRLMDVHRIFAVDSAQHLTAGQDMTRRDKTAHSIGIICILRMQLGLGCSAVALQCGIWICKPADSLTVNHWCHDAASVTSLIVPMDRVHTWQLLPAYVQACDIGRTRDSVGCVRLRPRKNCGR